MGLVALRRVAPRPAAQRTCDRPAQSTAWPPAERGWNCRSATIDTCPHATSDDTLHTLTVAPFAMWKSSGDNLNEVSTVLGNVNHESMKH